MGFFKRLFPQKAKRTYEPMRGAEPVQTQEEQDSVRRKMEEEMAAARDKREGRPPSQ
ncbi:MAG TPA: hypothetical protein VNN10_10975 [Dehalococcoidia bacterium]|nr:hypothetical protein [Dehalococcoidia bacterium]